jgi:hypothetical protein
MGCNNSKTFPAIIETEHLPNLYISAKRTVKIGRRASVFSHLKDPFIIPSQKEMLESATCREIPVKKPPTIPLELCQFYVCNKKTISPKKTFLNVNKGHIKRPNISSLTKNHSGKKATLSFFTSRLSSKEVTNSGALLKIAESPEKDRALVNSSNKQGEKPLFKEKQSAINTSLGQAKRKYSTRTLTHSNLKVNMIRNFDKSKPEIVYDLLAVDKSAQLQISQNCLSQTSIVAQAVIPTLVHQGRISSIKGTIQEIERDSNEDISSQTPHVLKNPSKKDYKKAFPVEKYPRCLPLNNTLANTAGLTTMPRNTLEDDVKAIRSLEITEILRKKFMSRQYINTQNIMEQYWRKCDRPLRQSYSPISNSASRDSSLSVADRSLRKSHKSN